jgi:NADPH:quinone reductase-like Zn-dependent oxidoreductase
MIVYSMTQEDWEIECQLEGFVRPQSFAVEAGKQSAVLITGATGFVGVHILAELLKHTTAQVWCLIRGKGEIVRVQSALQEALLWESLQEEEKGRIRVVFGDLGSKRLGISEDDWANLRCYRVFTTWSQT